MLNRFLSACAALATLLTLAACNTSPLQGRYYGAQPGAWIEFRPGTIVHGITGDTASYRVDGARILVSDPAGTIEGVIVNPTTVRFTAGSGAMADAFGGVWTARAAPTPSPTADAQPSAEMVVGRWRIPGETNVMDIRTDGTYSWGPRITGSYRMMPGQRIRMTTVEDGRTVGTLTYDFVVQDGQLTLKFPDGSATTFEHVD
jgi:hypothetical protein